jgi:hypothetical protein
MSDNYITIPLLVARLPIVLFYIKACLRSQVKQFLIAIFCFINTLLCGIANGNSYTCDGGLRNKVVWKWKGNSYLFTSIENKQRD